jgi:hypothetical protein
VVLIQARTNNLLVDNRKKRTRLVSLFSFSFLSVVLPSSSSSLVALKCLGSGLGLPYGFHYRYIRCGVISPTIILVLAT